MAESGSTLLHPTLEKQIKSFTARPAHALLVTGLPGSGKKRAGRVLAARLLAVDTPAQLDSQPYFIPIETPAGKQEIPIEAIRELNKQLRLKVPSRQTVNRVVLISDAHMLSLEAQNALLKNLEEPATGTVFILTAPSDRSLLPTIASRCRQLYVPPVSARQAKEYYTDQYDEAEIAAAWRLSQGSAGLLQAILAGNHNHPLNQAVEEAKAFLRASRYERLLQLNGLSKDRQKLILLLDALGRITAALQANAAQKSSPRQSKALLRSRQTINQLLAALEANASPRLVALQLALNINL